MKNGTKCTRPGYNHIDSVVESAIDNYFSSVLFRLRNMLVGGKLVPLVKEPCGIRGKILMSYFCSIPQHLGPVVWAPRSLVTNVLARQGHRTRQGGSFSDSWRAAPTQLTEAGLPHCPFPLDLLHLLLKCLSLWAVLGPFGHQGLGVNAEAFVFVYICFQEVMSI